LDEKQQQQTWVDMGTAHLDEKGRLVIPARIRQAAFGEQERPKVVIRLNPMGHILLSPMQRRA